MSNIAILPARGGSSRIKHKNIKLFFGKPIIQWTFKILKNSGLFKKIYVSTESKKIINTCKKIGINNFIIRPAKLANSRVGIREVMQHSIKYLEKENVKFDNVCCVFPCSPFIQIKNLKRALKILKKKRDIVVQPVTKFLHPIEKAFYMNSKNKLKPVSQTLMKRNTQDFSKKYYDLGQFYFSHKDYWFMNSKKVKGFGLELKYWETVDIDNKEDWELAKILFKLKKLLKKERHK